MHCGVESLLQQERSLIRCRTGLAEAEGLYLKTSPRFLEKLLIVRKTAPASAFHAARLSASRGPVTPSLTGKPALGLQTARKIPCT